MEESRKITGKNHKADGRQGERGRFGAYPGVPESGQSKWLKDHELDDSWSQVYADIFAMLSPVVASFPLAKLFALIFS
jgi:hypothetical protein